MEPDRRRASLVVRRNPATTPGCRRLVRFAESVTDYLNFNPELAAQGPESFDPSGLGPIGPPLWDPRATAAPG